MGGNPYSSRKGIRHMEFVARLYRKQIEGDRVFLHENPAHAKSWALPCIRRVARETGVDIAEADQCMFGSRTGGSSKTQRVLAKKPTKFMTNSRSIGRELSRGCDGQHSHQPLIDGRAADASRYPLALCRAICRGIAKEKALRTCVNTALLFIGMKPKGPM